ncbi:MAG: hypothetical protein ACLQGV_08350 [Bryobacteraceae bacterium]
MEFARALAASAVWAGILLGQSASEPFVEINFPGVNANRYINLTLNDFGLHWFAADDHGTYRELAGVPLFKVLETAGWRILPKDGRRQYMVSVEGDGDYAHAFPFSEVLSRSLENRAWLIAWVAGRRLARDEGPWLMVIGAGDVATLKIEHVRRIRVTNVATQQLGEDADFGRLSQYESEAGARIFWKEFVRVDGIPAMIVTWSTGVRRGKTAVLLSERVAQWDERRLRDFLDGRAALGIDPQAAIQRGSEFTVVRLRFPY